MVLTTVVDLPLRFLAERPDCLVVGVSEGLWVLSLFRAALDVLPPAGGSSE
jgi:hypothetical protein